MRRLGPARVWTRAAGLGVDSGGQGVGAGNSPPPSRAVVAYLVARGGWWRPGWCRRGRRLRVSAAFFSARRAAVPASAWTAAAGLHREEGGWGRYF
ncbi:unnamed protein product, partial [Urochloa humidicola]